MSYRNKKKKSGKRYYGEHKDSNLSYKNGRKDNKIKIGKVQRRSYGVYQGTIMANARGFAFCTILNNEIDDVFIPPTKLNGALNNDKVIIELIKLGDSKSNEGRVIKILERGTNVVVGNFTVFKNNGFVVPDDKKFGKDIFVEGSSTMGAKEGDKVVVKLTGYGKRGDSPMGEIIEVIGDITQKGNDILAIIRNYELYEEFPMSVVEASNHVPDRVEEKDLEGREDFRNELLFTIDGEDAKDFDDAVSIKKLDRGYELGVYIADVGHYVKRGSEIDQEAYLRGTSVYLPDRVLPMLPVSLSNGICSLNPNVDRLVLAVIMKLDDNANVTDYRIVEGVINSKARMTYTDVYKVLQGEAEAVEKYKHLQESFVLMADLSKKLEEKRIFRGSLDFNIPEAYIVVDDKGRTVDIKARERNAAHRLIESFMILANEVVAKHYNEKAIPFVYRVHEKPTTEKMNEFMEFCSSFGIKVNTGKEVTSKDLQNMLEAIKEESFARTINDVLLRSMQKAKYSTKCLGHYGLASTDYCHFTSPIRRYPDLTIHRIIKKYIHGEPNESELITLKEFTADSADRSSEREKLAEKAEREVDAYKKAEYMQGFIGDEFDAVITGVTANGVFVGLENTVEGFVAISHLPDDVYVFNEKKYLLQGKRHSYMIGQDMKVKLLSVNLADRKIDFCSSEIKLIDDENNEF